MGIRQRLALELHRSLRHTNARLHPLRTLFWECTLRCNMHCRHCGSDCTSDRSTPDMPAAHFLDAIDTLAPHIDPHKVFIIITGGEPLLRTDIEHVGSQLYLRGYPWGMVTNGFLLTEERFESLYNSGIHSMSISLDGIGDTHNWLRCREDAFLNTARAIDILASQKAVVWDIVTCVHPHNINTLADIKEWLIAHGVRSWRLFSIAPMGRAAANPDLQLSDSQLFSLMSFIQKSRVEDTRIDVSYSCEGFLGSFEGHVRDSLFDCRAGTEVASILCNGDISGCTSIRSQMAQGNIYHDDIFHIWETGFEKYRNRQWTRKDACASCKVWRYCEGSGLHLYDDNLHLTTCHFSRLNNAASKP